MPTDNLRVALPPLAAGAFGYYANSDQTTDLDPMMLENIEALSMPDDIQPGGGGGQKGPQLKYDCSGWFTGDGYRCPPTIRLTANLLDAGINLIKS